MAPPDGPSEPAPIPMLLWCPECHARHVDEGVMARRPHRTHACQTCGMQWKPALVATAGVQFLPGCRDEERNLIGGGPKKAPGGQP